MVYSTYRQCYHRKANTSKLYGEMFTSEIDIQHVKLEFIKCILFLEFKKMPPFTLSIAVIVLHLK